MFRILYSVLLPFLAPFIFCWIYRRRRNIRDFFPVQTVTLAGLGLVLVFLFVFSVPDKAPADSAYTPPKFENGKVIPAFLEQKSNEN